MTSTCHRCKFWLAEGAEQQIGECRRYPPQVVARVFGSRTPDRVWPITREDDWCGDFKKRGKQ